MVIDGVIQYACGVDQKRIRGAEDIAFEGSDNKWEVPEGLLPNLGRAKARNYFFDLMCGHPPRRFSECDFSDEPAGCWRSSMDKSVRWRTTFT